MKAIWRVDRFIGRLQEDLEAKGIAEDTLIVLTGDHGESFGDHGLRSHGTGLFEDQVHVPLILINPRLSAIRTRNDVVGGHIDLWPTIMDICSLPSHPQWQGRGLAGDDADGRRAFFYGGRSGNLGVREGRWKYFWDIRMNKHFLFDIRADPRELVDLAEEKPSERDRLNHQVKSWLFFHENLARRNWAHSPDAPNE